MFSFGRIILIIAVASFLAPSFSPGVLAGCNEKVMISSSGCQQSVTAPCCKHSCCRYTKHTVDPKVRVVVLNSPIFVYVPKVGALANFNAEEFQVSHQKIRSFYHPEFSQVLRL
jgi:hypothetical protein